jgi:hypothetical protein
MLEVGCWRLDVGFENLSAVENLDGGYQVAAYNDLDIPSSNPLNSASPLNRPIAE